MNVLIHVYDYQHNLERYGFDRWGWNDKRYGTHESFAERFGNWAE
jgi:hypothetical protein